MGYANAPCARRPQLVHRSVWGARAQCRRPPVTFLHFSFSGKATPAGCLPVVPLRPATDRCCYCCCELLTAVVVVLGLVVVLLLVLLVL